MAYDNAPTSTRQKAGSQQPVEVPTADFKILTFLAFFAGELPLGRASFLLAGDVSLKCFTMSARPGDHGGRGVDLVSFRNFSANFAPNPER